MPISKSYPEHPASRPPVRWPTLFFRLAVLGLLVYLATNTFDSQPGHRIEYSRFRDQLEAGNIAQVTVQGERIAGRFRRPVPMPVGEGEAMEQSRFVTYLPSFGDDGLLTLLESRNVAIETEPSDNTALWTFLLILGGPLLLFIALGYLFSRQSSRSGIFSIGRSRAKRYEGQHQRTGMADVAGASEAKVELSEISDFLREPSRYHGLGGRMPKGFLLVGPPGTGKTLLARAVAGEAGVPFFSITGSDFMEMFVGVGASRVRSLFEDAKNAAPAIIFIDELDSIGRRRGAGLGGGHDEREQTLNQLLSEMDGFEHHQGVIMLAATNRPDILDPALLRPGRFDRRIMIDLPTAKDRADILRIHARNKRLSPEVNLEDLARATPGWSGADLANMLNEAALLAARARRTGIVLEDVEAARDKIVMGLRRTNLSLTPEEAHIFACHETGHALVAAVLPHADPVHKVTIVPRGRAMGLTEQFPERDHYIYAKEYLLDRLAVLMAGRGAEELFLGTATSGAENDLSEATRLARKMVADWAMTSTLHAAAGYEEEEVFLGREMGRHDRASEAVASAIARETEKLLEAALNRARAVLEERRDIFGRIVERLKEKEELSGAEILELLDASTPAPSILL